MTRLFQTFLVLWVLALASTAAHAQSVRVAGAARVASRPANRAGRVGPPGRIVRGRPGGRTRAVAARRAPARAAATFNGEPVFVGELRAIVAGGPPARSAARALTGPGAARVRGAGLLVPGGEAALADYARMAVTPSHVVMVRRSGVIDIVRNADADAQIARGTPVATQRVPITRVGNTFLSYEPGPGDTVRLYRQLPAVAAGDVASNDTYTSFALGSDAAFHLFGPTGASVCLAVPREVFNGAVAGTMGGTGWSGGGLAVDELTEVQIDSRIVRELTAGANAAR